MHSKKHAIALALVLILMAAGSASAARKGRLVGRVLDPDGNPVEGVRVTATSNDVPGFREVETTDMKGVFKVNFDEINVVYKYRFEKAGYQTLMTEQMWRKDGTGRHDFTLYPGEAPTVGGLAPVSTTSPAITAFNSGVEAYDDKDYAAAVAKFEEALEHDPELRYAWGALSAAQLELKHYQEAAEAAEKAIALGSSSDTVLRTRWEAYRNLGDEAKAAAAIQDLERAGRRTEEAKKVFNEAVRLSKAGDLEGAFVRFQEAVEIDPNLQVALLGVATTGLKIDRNAEAAAAAEIILEEDPGNDQALRLRYNASLKIGDEDLIFDSLVGLAAVEPEMALDALWRLAVFAYDGSDMERAKERFGWVLEVEPNYPQCHYYLGLIYMNEGANEEAAKYFERFVELAPNDPEAATASELAAFLSGS